MVTPPVKLLLCGSAALLAGALTACLCDRAGCRAFDDPFDDPTIATGVAGIAATHSDDVSGTCSACPLSVGRVYLWSSPDPVADEAAATALVAETPLHQLDVDGEFQQELEPGDYLACIDASGPGGLLCGPFSLAAGDVATVNRMANFGSNQLNVFAPGAKRPGSQIFSVDSPGWAL